MQLRGPGCAAAALAATLAASTAGAGVDVKTRTGAPGEQPAEESGRMRAQGDFVRIDMVSPPSGQGSSSLVFDAENDVLRIFRHADKTYVEIDQKTANEISAKMAEARKMMDEQLAKMPPQQRAMMEKMMKGGGMPFPKADAPKKQPPLEAKATGESETIDGTPCRVYTLTRGGQARGDVCVAAWDAVGIDSSDVAVLSKLGRFQSKMAEAMAGAVPGAEQPFELLERVDGFPLRTRHVEGGAVVSETFFEGLAETEVPPDTFAVPAGYTKQEMGPAKR